MKSIRIYLLLLSGVYFSQCGNLYSQIAARIYVNSTIPSKGSIITICQNSTISFIDSTRNSTGRNWDFNIGTPSTGSTLLTQVVTFNSNGLDTIFLFADSASIKFDTTFVLVQVQKPTASFTFSPNNACAGTTVNFTNSSTGVGTLSYSWNFSATAGAPSSTSSSSPGVSFNPAAGGSTTSYSVTLTVTDGNTCSSNITNSVSVKQNPNPIVTDSNLFASPSFTNCAANPTISSPNYRLTLINATIPASSLISNYTLNWGIGSTITLPSTFTQISNLYTSLGVFNLTFTATNTIGCAVTKTYKIANQSNPAVGINGPGSTNGCAPQTFPFVLGSYLSNSPGTYYIFDFDDGTPRIRWDTVITDTIWHTYTTSSCIRPGGSFTSKVIAYNFCDSTTGTVNNIRIWTKPKANFSVSPDTTICVGSTLTITNTTIPGYYGPTCLQTTLYNWTFIGGSVTSSTLQNPPTITYGIPGYYMIRLIASNPCGPDTMIKYICVQPTPIPSYNFTNIPSSRCSPFRDSIINTSNTLGSCGNTIYKWSLNPITGFSFVSGTTSDSLNPIIQFNSKGSYVLKLSITNKCGTFARNDTIKVKGIPVVTLPSGKTYCDSQVIAFNATNINHNPNYDSSYGSLLSAFNWSISPIGYSFITGNINSRNPVIAFPNSSSSPITYTVTITTTNECGTSLPATQLIIINPKPTFASCGATQTLCGLTSTLLSANSPLIGNGIWTFLSGPVGSTIVTPSNPNSNLTGLSSAGNPSIYRFTWTISSPGCTSTSCTDSIIVYPSASPGTIASSANVCSGTNSGTLTLSGYSGTILRWEKSINPFASWTTISNTATTQTYLNLTQTTQYRVVIQSGVSGICGVINSAPVQITVDSASLGGHLNSNDTVCISSNSGTINLTGNRGNVVRWEKTISPYSTWTSISNITTSQTYLNLTQTTLFRAVVQNGTCTSVLSDTVRIQVDSLPSPALAHDTTYCLASIGSSITGALIANAITRGNGLWTFLSGPSTPLISNVNTNSTTASNLLFGTYNFLWKVSNGKCSPNKDTADTATIIIYNPIQSTIAASQTICSGQSPSILTSTLPTGGNSSYTYQWQQSTNGTNYTDTAGRTAANFQPPILTSNRWYRLNIFSGNCVFTTNIVSITVLPSIANNSISPNASLCIGSSSPTITGTTPSGGITFYSYQWQKYNGSSWVNTSLADTLQNYSPGALGSTTVYRRIITSGACSGIQSSISNTDTITINPLPIVNAGIDFSRCSNQLTFSLSGTPIGGTWSGTGVISGTSFNPSVMALGPYTLVYTYTNTNGCTNRDTVILTVISPPTVNAGLDITICQNAPSYQLSGFTPIGGTWSGRGVSTSGLFNPSIAGSGLDTLIYNFTAGSGCSGIDTLMVTVYPRPNGNFTIPTQICPNSILPITSTVNSLATVNSYLWTVTNTGSFPNSILSSLNTSSTIATFPDDTTSADITYLIKLKTVTNFGCADSVTDTIILRRRPLPKFTTGSNINCGPALYSITNNTSNVLSNYLWSTNPSASVNINTTTSTNPQITFPVNSNISAQVYSIKLIATRNDATLSCVDTANNSITVYPKPIIAFSGLPSDSGCSPLTVNFQNNSIPRNSELISSMTFSWNFGTYGTSITTNPTKTFYNSGVIDSIYPVRLIGTTQWGCKDTLNRNEKVFAFPKSNFVSSIYTSCAPFIIDNSIITLTQYPFANDTYLWQVLNKSGSVTKFSTGTSILPDTIYLQNDTLYYRLITSNNRGCKPDTFTRLFRTIANPVAGFTMNDSVGCNPLITQFTNTSTTGVSYLWNFGNGDTSSQQNPKDTFINLSHTINQTYSVKLVIKAGGSLGCKDSVTKTITVFPRPLASYILATPSCVNSVLTATNSSIYKSGGVTYGWKILQNTLTQINDTTLSTPAFSFPDNKLSNDTIYNIRLRVTSIEGCIHDTIKPITILRRPNAIFTTPQPNCGPAIITLNNATSNVSSSWHWTINPSNSNAIISNDTAHFPNINFAENNTNDSVNYTIKLFATRIGTSCIDSANNTVTIYPKPQSQFTTTTKDSCGPRLVNFTNTSNAKNNEPQSSMNFLWSFLNSNYISANASGNFVNSLIFNDSIYNVRLIVTTKHGCKDTTNTNVIVRPNAKAIFNIKLSVSCAPFNIDTSIIKAIIFPNANSSYQWYANNSPIGTGILFPGYIIANQADSVLIKLKTLSLNGCKNDSISFWFYTIQNPKPNFLAVDSITCSGSTIIFNNTSTPATGLTYLWQLGNATNTSSNKNPNTIFYNYGTNDTTIAIKLIVIAGGSGCRDSITKNIVIKPLPKINFIFTDTVFCYPKSIGVLNTSTTPPAINLLGYKWKVSGPTSYTIVNDTSSNGTNIIVPDNISGGNRNYLIKLKAQSTFGCIDSISKNINIPTRPIANFNLSKDSLCSYLEIQTNNLSLYGNTYKWVRFSPLLNIFQSDSFNTNISMLTHLGIIDSVYKLKLIVSNNIGCKDSIEKNIIAYPKPISQFVSDTNSGCTPLIIHFSNNSIGKAPNNYKWLFEKNIFDTAKNTLHVFNGSAYHDTTYIVQLISTSKDGCKDTVAYPINAKSGAVAKLFLTDSIYCMNSLNQGIVPIVNNSYGDVDTFYLDYGDGSSLVTTDDSANTHYYNIEGYYKIKLKAKNSCRTSFDSVTIKILKTPYPTFTLSDTLGCNPFVVKFTNNTINFEANYLWNFGNGLTSSKQNPDSVIYYQSKIKDTTYIIKLTASNFCGIRNLQDTVRVLPIPVASFLMTTDSGCSPLTVGFLNTTTGLPSTIQWFFGNGDSSTRYNPYMEVFKTGDSPSVYKVKLIAINMCGSDTASKKVKVQPNTVRAFFITSGNTGCAPFTVTFTDSSVGGNSLSWNLGGGMTSTIKKPTVKYTNPGVYYAYQYVNNGCSYDTSFVVINVLKTPQFNISKSSSLICKYSKVSFTSTLIDSGAITWYFGDGDSSNFFNVDHIYNTAGMKNITAVLRSFSNNCPRILHDSIMVNDLPIVKLNIDTPQGCIYKYFVLNSTGSNASYLIWNLGDGNFITGTNTTHTYNNVGIFQVKLIGENVFGCKDSMNIAVTVYPKPFGKFDYSPKDTCTGPVDVKFTNQSTGANNYYWDFGNGLNSNLVNPITHYSAIGNYPINLISSNQYNCYDTATNIYHVYHMPSANFSFDPKEGCEPLSVNFTNNSTYSSEYIWSFGDGDTSHQLNPSHIYNSFGKYSVKLVAIQGGICFDSLLQSNIIEVFKLPTSKYDTSLDYNYRPYSHVNFINQSINATKYLWEFGDGQSSEEISLMHKYSAFGEYLSKLIAISSNGCRDTSYKLINIPKYNKGLFVPNAFTPEYGEPEVRLFKPVGIELRSYHLKIYNKWGEMIWETNEITDKGEPKIGWNGLDKNGIPCMQGAYVWAIEAEFTDGTFWEGMKYPTGSSTPVTSGNVTLIR